MKESKREEGERAKEREKEGWTADRLRGIEREKERERESNKSGACVEVISAALATLPGEAKTPDHLAPPMKDFFFPKKKKKEMKENKNVFSAQDSSEQDDEVLIK